MTKSVRHKKFRKQEVKKITFKLGKKLKKAQNETKTDFKAQKIVLREQLSVKAASSLVTKKHLNLTELLSRLSHHSVYVRQDGLNGLKELVLKNNKEELAPHLSALFRGLNPCILDTDHLVRTTAVRVVEALIMKNGTLIKPYFTSLTAHLSCAMVHMNTGVQSDSLALMDALLCYAPSLIAQRANAILENFFRLISRKIDHQQKSSSADSYALISNPASRLASIRWRIKLLRSLSKYLEAILGEKSKIEASVPISSWQVVTLGCMPLTEGAVGSRTSVHRTKILTEEEDAKTFILNLVPLLFQTLSEVGYNSENQIEASGTPLEPITVELLRCISEIILHLWNITELVIGKNPTQCPWMMKALRQHVTKDVFIGFPYCVLESRSNKSSSKSKEKINIDVECHQLNINLASLSLLYLKPDLDMEGRIFSYYIKLLSTGHVTSQLKLDKMVSTVCTLLKKEKMHPSLSGSLLEASLQCYQNLPSSDKSRSTLLKLPLQASEYTCRHLWKSPALEKWMIAVVETSLQNDTVDDPLMELLLQFRLRNTPDFASILAQKKDLLREKMKSRMTSAPHCKISQESATS